MNYILQAVTSNGIAVLLLVSLLLNYFRKYKSREWEHKVFSVMIFINLVQCVVEPLTIVIDGKLFSGARPLALVLNSLLYANNICFSLLWSVYADLRVKAHRTLAHQILKYIPAILVVAGALANLFTPVYFYLTPQNLYQRTNLFFVAFAINYGYLIWGTLTAYGPKSKQERYVFIPALTFLMPVFVVSIAQYLLMGTSLLWAGSAIGLTSAYISLLDENAFIDSLSGVFSRHYMNQYLFSLPRQAADPRRAAGIMLDIDDFKQINDRYGHLTGDEVISQVGALLRKAAGPDGMVFRYAGDEFTIILTLRDGSEVDRTVARIHQELDALNAAAQRPYRISLSMGHALHMPGEKNSQFIKRMDDNMYADKRGKE